jgi:hypothetical protein
MRPPILQWKIMVLLLAVVVAGVSLGSALHSDEGNVRIFYTQGINSPQSGGWTGYTPLHTSGVHLFGSVDVLDSNGKVNSQMRSALCANLKAMIPKTQKAFRLDFKLTIRRACRKLR